MFGEVPRDEGDMLQAEEQGGASYQELSNSAVSNSPAFASSPVIVIDYSGEEMAVANPHVRQELNFNGLGPVMRPYVEDSSASLNFAREILKLATPRTPPHGPAPAQQTVSVSSETDIAPNPLVM